MNQMIVSLLNTLGLRSDPQTSVVFRNTVEAITQPQIDAISPVPFAFSALIEVNDGAISGLFEVLDYAAEVPLGAIQGEEANLEGFVFYLDTQRGSYWGDIQISVNASDIFDVDVKLETIDNTECNSLVVVLIDGETTAGTSHAVAITASGGGHSITRTFTLNVVADP